MYIAFKLLNILCSSMYLSVFLFEFYRNVFISMKEQVWNVSILKKGYTLCEMKEILIVGQLWL